MYGPNQIGFWSSHKAPNCGAEHQFLVAGQKYRVIKPFNDHGKDVHLAGEEWTFLGFSFLPYEDGLSWFVSFDDIQEWQIPMQWREEEQGNIIDSLHEYIQAI